MRRWVVMAVAETVKACGCPTQIDYDKEKRSQRVQAEMGAKPRQSDRQSQVGDTLGVGAQPAKRLEQCDLGNGQCEAVDDRRGALDAAQNDRENCDPQQSRDT